MVNIIVDPVLTSRHLDLVNIIVDPVGIVVVIVVVLVGADLPPVRVLVALSARVGPVPKVDVLVSLVIILYSTVCYVVLQVFPVLVDPGFKFKQHVCSRLQIWLTKLY